MKRGKVERILFITVIVLLVTGILGFSYGAVKTFKDVSSTFNTGGIDIEVNNYTVKDGKEVIMARDNTTMLHGRVSYIPKIINKAEKCYIRVRFTAETSIQEMDITRSLYGIGDEWSLKGGYLYYDKCLENNDIVPVCEGFQVPEEWDYQGDNKMKVCVNVDAVQAKNFTPDFSADDPWGYITAERSQINDGYMVNTMEQGKGNGNVKVVCDDGEIAVSSEDLFKDVFFMAGDQYDDCITLRNDGNKKADIMFKAEYEESPLIETMQLEIDNGGMFYKGSLAGEKLKEFREIAALKSGEEKEINMSVSLPESAGNEHQVKSDGIIWCFAVNQDKDVTEGDFKQKMIKAVKTGDSSKYLAVFGILLLISAAAIAVLKKKGGEQ